MQIMIDGTDLHAAAAGFGLDRLSLEPHRSISSVEWEIRHALTESGRLVVSVKIFPPTAGTVASAHLMEAKSIDLAPKMLSTLRLISSSLESVSGIDQDIADRMSNDEITPEIVGLILESVKHWTTIAGALHVVDGATGGAISFPPETSAALMANVDSFGEMVGSMPGSLSQAPAIFATFSTIAMELQAHIFDELLPPEKTDAATEDPTNGKTDHS